MSCEKTQKCRKKGMRKTRLPSNHEQFQQLVRFQQHIGVDLIERNVKCGLKLVRCGKVLRVEIVQNGIQLHL